ncbi:MAG: hypothetical protein GEU88_10190 [Solirubrobacterales bacterium]|nr:hypothetical protein [Solirubrobacterales bacterium]
MRIRRPSHTTVVAYLALFAALGGTAIAARDDTGAKELKKPVIRERTTTSDVGNFQDTQVVVGCKRREQLLSGTAGWKFSSGSEGSAALLRSVELDRDSVTAKGAAYNQRNTLTVQAVCLPR